MSGATRERVIQLWQLGYDTKRISELLCVAEGWVYFVLARWREERRAA